MKTFRLSTILSCPENASRSCGRMRFSNSRSLSMFRMFLSVPMMPFAVGCPSVADYGCRRFPRWTGTNIVKAEGKGKSKTQFSDLTLPRRLLYSGNIVKAESEGGSGRSFRSWPCRADCCLRNDSSHAVMFCLSGRDLVDVNMWPQVLSRWLCEE